MKTCFKHPKRKAVAVWVICSDGTKRGICRECDFELNKIGLKWAFPEIWRKMFAEYRASVKAQEP